MLLDPFEEQFDLPAAFVERADGRGRQPELVGEEHQLLSRFGVPEADAPQVFGVMLGGVVAVQRDGLIANDAGRAVCGGGIDPMSIDVRFGAGDEEGSGQVQHMEPGDSSAYMRQSRVSLASASVERRTGSRKPME